ncbi:uncharacterized protein FA14DRAFT_160224 [Meira miltonrushii]|uniref:BZIP domain-containing protein n=1 Tax=Meira miltonrushii TaxID=1280837 RepID=A0A316VB55_9BASI|nr:uncharacterized protein FA14DRAFT_160224 [Meira miltonrushii]PWN34762.1 hypothetical protein FA14DRAFT_160224 [Meira miltonrushii]
MPPLSRNRAAPYDRFTDASASAVSSGYTAAMSLGPQPKMNGSIADSEEGADWLRNLKQVSGMYDGGPGSGVYIGDPANAQDDSEDEDELDSEGEQIQNRPKKRTKGGKPSKRNSKGSVAGNEDSAAATRKAQNRLAQREFRQRKQQYIRALETRVELLSSDHDTQVDRLRWALRGLLAENNQLRQIVAAFASFVGLQQIGGPLQKAGVSRQDLEDLISNSAEKVMTDAWQHWPGARECEALRQIRLDSNLPPEGLPESNKIPESVRVRSNPTPPTISTLGTNASTSNSKSASPKVNGTTANEATKGGKKKKEANGKGKGTPLSPSSNAATTDTTTTQAQTSNEAATPATNAPSFSLPPGDNAHLMASFFGNGPGMLQSPAPTPSAFTFTPGFSGMPTPSIGPQGQESNAILASLFGSSGMSGFMGPGGINGNPNQGMNPFGQQGPPQQHGGQDMNGMSSPFSRQKMNGGEEPEEVHRVEALVAQLRKERERYGSGKDPNELNKIGMALNELIRHMANFRRQPSYHLPSVLEPSEIQQTRPHDPLIDALPFPGVRQNLIAQQENLVIEDVVLSILQFSTLHPGDVTDEHSWELLYGFLIAYPQLVDQRTLDNANRWRARRKESILTFDDLTLRHV